MKLIRIINGTFGHKPDGARRISPVQPGDPPILVSDAQAARLILLRVAEYADERAPGFTPDAPPVLSTPEPLSVPDNAAPPDTDAPDNAPDDGPGKTSLAHIDVDALKDSSVPELREFCRRMGVDLSGLRSKADIIGAITETAIFDKDGADTGTDDAPLPRVEDVVQ